MNDLLQSNIRTILKVLGTALATHGATKAAGIVNSEDAIGLVLLIVGYILSHWFHRKPASATPSENTSRYAWLLIGTLALSLTGCATEQVTTDNAGLPHTNFVANATALQVADTAKALAPTVAATVPQPYGAMAGLALGLIGLLGGGVATSIAVAKNKKNATTLQAVTAGIESALPSIQEALTTTATSGVVSSGDAANIAKANAVLTAVKDSIHSATVASGTAQNLDQSLAAAGIGPTAR